MPNNVGDKGHHNASSAVQPSTTDQLVDAIYQTSDGVAADLAAERTADEIATVRTQAVNAYTSTEALRSALAEAKAALNTIRNASLKGCEYGYGKPEQFADELYRSHGDVHRALVKIDAALSGSPAPSTEGSKERLRELVAQTLAKYAGDAFSSLNIVFEENSAPWPSAYSPREQDSFRILADCVLATIAGAEPDAARTALAGVTAPCEECGGHGGFESIVGFDAHGPSHQWTPCQPCGGTGSVFSGAAPSKEPPCIQRFSGRGLSSLEASKQAQTDKSEIEPDGRK